MRRADWPVVAAGVILAALVLGWWFKPVPARAITATLVAPQGTNSGAVLAPALASQPLVNPAAQRLQHGSDDVQLCGGGWVRRDDDQQIDLDDLARAVRVEEVGNRLTAALRADDRSQAQGLALYFDVVKAGTRAEREAPLCEAEDCAARPVPQRLLNAIDALARFASTSGDPDVYGWALRICEGSALRAAVKSCAGLSISRWSQLDPDNAAPWLEILVAAAEGQDRAGTEEALHRIATARRYDAGRAAMSRTALDHLGYRDGDLVANQVVMIGLMGMQSASGIADYQQLHALCRGDALRDPNRRQVCDGAAQTLSQRSEDLMTQMFGVRIGEGLGWPMDQIDQLNGQRQAFFAATLQQSALDLGDGLLRSCTDLRQRLGRLRESAQLGETGAMREWVAQAGTSPDYYLLAGRRLRERIAASADAADLYASAPSRSTRAQSSR